MTLLVIGLCVLFVGFTAAELTCPDNEVIDKCPKSCKTTCPKSEKEAKEICKTPDPCPESACQCGFNSRRADNGACIDIRSCPPFDCSARPNQMFDPCPTLCPSEDCSQASLKGKCPSIGIIGIVLICNPSCRCIKDHYRLDGDCVPEAKCGNGSTTTVDPEEKLTPPSTDDNDTISDDYWTVDTQTLFTDSSNHSNVANSADLNKSVNSKESADEEAKSDNEKIKTKSEAKNEVKATAYSVAEPSCGKKGMKCGPNEECKCRESCPPETCFSIVASYECESTQKCKNDCFCKDGFLRANETAPCRPMCECEEMAGALECNKN